MAEALYKHVFSDVKRAIFEGEYKPGDMLPSENELAAKYNTSRVTIRKSLGMLENERIVKSWHGKGYFVIEPEHAKFTFVYEEHNKALESKLQYIRLLHPEAEVQAALHVDSRQRVVSIMRILYNTKKNMLCDLMYLPYQKGMPLIEMEIQYADFPDLVKNKVSTFAIHTKMEIGIAAATGEVAKRLVLEEGTTVLVIYRYLYDEMDRPVAFGKRYLHPDCGHLTAHSGFFPT